MLFGTKENQESEKRSYVLPRYDVRFIRDREDVRAAQLLRDESLIREVKNFGCTRSYAIDREELERFCAHLIAVDRSDHRVVASYRVMFPENQFRAGRYGMDDLFHTASLFGLQSSTAEIAEVFVHPSVNCTAVLTQIWEVLAKELVQRGIRYVVGLTCIHAIGTPCSVMKLYRALSLENGASTTLWVEPRTPIASSINPDDGRSLLVRTPPLLLGYFNLGAQMLGEPAYDAKHDRVAIPFVFNVPYPAHHGLATLELNAP
jgi:putative hemolysin